MNHQDKNYKYLKSEYNNLLQAQRIKDHSAKLTIAHQVKAAIQLVEEYEVGDLAGIKY